MKSDGSGRSVLFRDVEKSAVAPAFSPEGDQVAFGLGRFFQSVFGTSIADIALMNTDGTGFNILTDGTGNCGFPSWAPDGRHIVYRTSNGKTNAFRIMDVQTGEAKPLDTGSNQDNFPAWSPVDDRIAFTSYRDGDYEIYTMKADGTDLRRLTHAPGNDAHCTWSPDGQWIAFSSGRAGFKDEAALHPYNPQPYGEICVMRADGSDFRILTDNQFEDGSVTFIPTSDLKRASK